MLKVDDIIPLWRVVFESSSYNKFKFGVILQDILDSFVDSEFWYVDQGILAAADADRSSSRQEDKWWLPIPRVPSGSGLSEAARRQLQHKRDSTNQILKAVMAINSLTLADMDVPASYLEALPKVSQF